MKIIAGSIFYFTAAAETTMDRYFSSGDEPLEVNTTGHFAPTTKPAILALQVQMSIFPMIFPISVSL